MGKIDLPGFSDLELRAHTVAGGSYNYPFASGGSRRPSPGTAVGSTSGPKVTFAFSSRADSGNPFRTGSLRIDPLSPRSTRPLAIGGLRNYPYRTWEGAGKAVSAEPPDYGGSRPKSPLSGADGISKHVTQREGPSSKLYPLLMQVATKPLAGRMKCRSCAHKDLECRWHYRRSMAREMVRASSARYFGMQITAVRGSNTVEPGSLSPERVPISFLEAPMHPVVGPNVTRIARGRPPSANPPPGAGQLFHPPVFRPER